MKEILNGICAAKGFKASGVHAGIRKNKDKKDLMLVVSETLCNVASVYTQNKVKGAPILVTKENTADGKAQAIICNSGNANTCNADGVEIAQKMCKLVEKYTQIKASDVVVASTGVIGQPLPIEPIENAMPLLVDSLSEKGSNDASLAIMTTDTKKKEFAVEFTVDGTVCRVGAIAKGSGMIHPNMATLLCFVTTDVAISNEMLKIALTNVVNETLNMVSIDGDTSTNDMMTCMSSGLAGNKEINSLDDSGYKEFYNGLLAVMIKIAKAIAKDGEGATKLLECKVSNAETTEVAKKIAKSVVCSSLLKAAIFASDANWGRILCAIGYADAEFDITKISVDLVSAKGAIRVCEKGVGVPFSEDDAKVILLQDEITVDINCNQGDSKATAWGCDLTYDYVKINADYRT